MKPIYLILISITCCVPLCAQNIYTLEKCIETGLEHNYSVRIIQTEEQVSSNNATPGTAG